MESSRAHPWRDWAEWEACYADLFALDDPAARARGVQRVATWRSRGRVPLAVESTAVLAELELSTALSEPVLCLALGMALTRLVNGVVDPMQQRARATSVQRLAAEVALPASLVALRHEATHNQLPSMGALKADALRRCGGRQRSQGGGAPSAIGDPVSVAWGGTAGGTASFPQPGPPQPASLRPGEGRDAPSGRPMTLAGPAEVLATWEEVCGAALPAPPGEGRV
ncbi:hypothetical protein EMIHUDRAFT_245610 [Emiliania huxleyi CCMP1516]|uniref:Uncharacterized protein n=2 Tax=Emiliania huxleyi TaxID=2903 RepID=A0A0D3IWY9_EMIH1|nr:hypothetical protein EMIHUDRAFT_245610 [Emiliania huxleyi CCMP1516]EOD15774.1 hypothetical protein EMIHUDRAFT_245610 [Emiliania huxleyi CCMP1516]|eukprot:XP_005768203.1 hypothetical protein EMIHUDRAFT_245610 [Emiliania huxleyi CCMP1516]